MLISAILATPALWFAGYISLPNRIYGFVDEDR